MPSLTEGLPYTLLEAMASGVPVVASAVGDIPCLVEHGESGLLAPPADAGALEICMAAVLKDRDKARGIGQEGRRNRARPVLGAAHGGTDREHLLGTDKRLKRRSIS